VNQCNVSAFISNLPGKVGDTMRFSTKDASGSTSQAVNVMEALECGGSALLVDEDSSVSDHSNDSSLELFQK
jgi:predicted ABC-class ATPase